jgi:NAD-dependent dihydropyrimidine dehydrogenase PreA subunit
MMKRDMVKIDGELCNGCGICIPNCHEGALQIIDGKAVLVSDLMCDGLGACIGHCPEGAITIEKREAAPYNEALVMEEMVRKSTNTIIAHLHHLKDHGEDGYFNEAVDYLLKHESKLNHDVRKIIRAVGEQAGDTSPQACGCPGSAQSEFRIAETGVSGTVSEESALSHWPVQMHLINPGASWFRNCDLLVAADCTAFSMGGFHQKYISGRKVVIACPKLDQGTEIYIEKFRALIDSARVNTITLIIMEVPCCGGLVSMIRQAMETATRKVPLKLVVAATNGTVIRDEWI